MGYPSRLAVATTQVADATTSEVKIPDGSVGADILILFWVFFDVQAVTPTWVDISTTFVDSDDTGGLTGGWSVYTYVTTGSEGWSGTNDTTTITHTSATCTGYSISYDNTTLDGSIALGKATSSSANQINQGNLIYGSTKSMEWVHFGLNDGDAGAPGYPTDYDLAQNSVLDLGDAVRGSMCIKQSVASSEDPGVWSQASPTHWSSALVAIPGAPPASSADRVALIPAARVWTPN